MNDTRFSLMLDFYEINLAVCEVQLPCPPLIRGTAERSEHLLFLSFLSTEKQ